LRQRKLADAVKESTPTSSMGDERGTLFSRGSLHRVCSIEYRSEIEIVIWIFVVVLENFHVNCPGGY
jgi:hypothetical protein